MTRSAGGLALLSLLGGCQVDVLLRSLSPSAAEPAAELAGGAAAGEGRAQEAPRVVVVQERPEVRRERQRRQDLFEVTGREVMMRPAPPDPAVTSAAEVWEGVGVDVRRERFAVSTRTRTPVTDFLFVVDNSVSMTAVYEQVVSAFDKLSRERPFPDGARIAVMSTLPADPADLGLTHPAVRAPWAAWEPGFLQPVDREGIARFVRSVPELAERFPYVGCSGWFSPFDKDIHGVPCLAAHVRTARSRVAAEAGMTAVAQAIEAAGDRPLFRAGAAVNLVFVSDTHDPGLPAHDPAYAALVASRPGAVDLMARVMERQQVASFRVHAVVPLSSCGERWRHIGPVYADAARLTGGVVRDLCTTDDFGPLIREIAETGPLLSEAVVSLGAPAGERLVVRLDERRVEVEASRDRRSLKVAVPLTATVREVEATYLPAR